MKNHSYRIIQAIMVISLAIGFSNPALANDGGVIELSKSHRSETLGDIYSFGLHTSTSGSSNAYFYAGMNLLMLDNNDINRNDSAFKIFIGQSFGKTITPFYEIGTDLYGFLTLFGNNNETHTCSNEHECALDFYFKIGLKINLGDHLILGFFHENIDFGAFHENLSGEHRYTGSSIGFAF